MRVALVCPNFYPQIGGVESIVFQLASQLVKKKFIVTVLTQTDNKNLQEIEEINGFTIKRFKARNILFSKELGISIELLQYLKKNSSSYQLVHVHNYHAFPALVAALTKKSTLLFSPYYHGYGHTLLTKMLMYPYRLVGRYVLLKSDKIFCISNVEAELLSKHFPSVHRKIIIIPPAINVQAIKVARPVKHNKPFIIVIGRLVNYKNILQVIAAIPYLENGLQLCIVGNGSQFSQLENYVKLHKLTKRVIFMTNADDNILYQLLKTAKVYITMSRYETYNLSLLEAAVAQTGIVASDIPAHSEIMRRFKITNVQLVQLSATPQYIAKRIEFAAKHKANTKEVSLTWESVTKTTVKEYMKLTH